MSHPKFHYLFPQYYELDPQDQVEDRDNFDPTEDQARALCQAATVLRHRGVDIAVKLHAKCDDTLTHRWNLTTEHAVVLPQNEHEMASWTDGDWCSTDSVDFIGVELISPIMQAPDMYLQRNLEGDSFQDLDRVIDALEGPSDVPFVFLSRPENSSVHVHIGLKPGEDGPVDIPLEILKHLAWIVLSYEDIITLLHHPERRGFWGTKIRDHATSNRRAFQPLVDGKFPRYLHSCDEALAYNPAQAFWQIFGTVGTHKELQKVMSNDCTPDNPHFRNTFVNFSNIAPVFQQGPEVCRNGEEPFKTVEFRQHCGTSDPDEIKEWIYFVTCLVRTAERKAKENADIKFEFCPFDDYTGYVNEVLDREKAKYTNVFHQPGRTLRELFDLMELPIERRRYWWQRATHFQSDEFKEYSESGTCNPNCTGFMLRDSEGWGEGECIKKPWDDDADTEMT